MSLLRRVIVCLDVRGDRVVKGTRFVDLRDVGEPSALASHYEADGADEVVFLDIAATVEHRATLLDTVRRTAERLFIPLTVGGGIRSVRDASEALRAGADKVSVNSSALAEPDLMTRMADQFGSQCVVVSIDAVREADRWVVYTHGGTRPTGRDAVAWAEECARRGVGEILVTSIDRDGTREGYDLLLTAAISAAVDVPVIASGGAGSASHIRDVFTDGRADAALVAGILHENITTVRAIKQTLAQAGLTTRSVS